MRTVAIFMVLPAWEFVGLLAACLLVVVFRRWDARVGAWLHDPADAMRWDAVRPDLERAEIRPDPLKYQTHS